MPPATPGSPPPVPAPGASVMQTIMVTLFTEWLTHLIANPQTFRGGSMSVTVTKILKRFPISKVGGIVADQAKRQALLDAVKQSLEIAAITFPGTKNLLLRKGKEAIEALFAAGAPTDATGWETLVDRVMGTTTSATSQPAVTAALTNPQDYVLGVRVTIGGAERCLTFPLAIDSANKPILDASGKPTTYAPEFTTLTDGRNPTCVVIDLLEADRLRYVPHDWTPEGELRVAMQGLQAPPAPAVPATPPDHTKLTTVVAAWCADEARKGGLGEVVATTVGDYMGEFKNLARTQVDAFITQAQTSRDLDLNGSTITDRGVQTLVRLIRAHGGGNLQFTNSISHAVAMGWLGLKSAFFSWPMLLIALVVLMGVTSSVLGLVFWIPMFYTPLPLDLAVKRWFISLGLVLVPFAPLILFRESVGKIVDGVMETVGRARPGWGDAGRTFWWVVCWVIGISMIPLLTQMAVAFTGLPTLYITMLSLPLSTWLIVAYLYRKEEKDIGLRNAGYAIGVGVAIVFLWGMWQTHGVPWWETFDLFGADTTGTVASSVGSEGVATPQAHRGFMPEEWFSRLQEAGGAMLCSLMSLAVFVLVGSGIFGTVLKKFGADDAAKVVFKITSWAGAVIGVGLAIITVIVASQAFLEGWNRSAPERAQAKHGTSVKLIAPSSGDEAPAPTPTRTAPAHRSVKQDLSDFCRKFPTHTACKR